MRKSLSLKVTAFLLLLVLAFLLASPFQQTADAGWWSCAAAVAACAAATASATAICATAGGLATACGLALYSAYSVCKKVQDKC